jgi:Ca-activated chloride channel family protein
MRQLSSLSLLIAVALVVSLSAQDVPVFKSSVEQVAVAAIVRDAKGKLVTTLKATDFELIDEGQKRTLSNVWSEPSPASVAIVMDVSGSMTTKMALARETADTFVAGLKPGADEVAMYAFDTSLQEVRPFSMRFSASDGAFRGTKAFGATSLWDAVAETARKISDRQRRRAMVVITDGVDSASTLKPADVSAIASELDVPVYIVVIRHFSDEDGGTGIPGPIRGPLADLASWTGGNSIALRDSSGVITATAEILSELHNQYIIAFEPGKTQGWHGLILRAKKPGLFVRARSGYMVK